MENLLSEISIALGNGEVQRLVKNGTVNYSGVKLNYADFPVINRAFAPMVRTLCFDISELALVTFFQALEAAKPIRLLPIVVSGQMHHGSIFYDPTRGALRIEDLPGKCVGVRSYTQTTGMWVRGILSEQFGLDLSKITWLSWEDAHVAEYEPPANVIINPGIREIEMLETGAVCSVITTAEKAKDAGLLSLIPDVNGATQSWYKKHKTVPINHMVAVKDKFAEENPLAVRNLYDMFCTAVDLTAYLRKNEFSSIGYGAERIWNSGALQLAMDYCLEQKLIAHTFSKEEIFTDIIG